MQEFILTIIEAILTFVFTVVLLQHYASKSVSCFMRFTIFIGWLVSFMIIVMLPLDIHLSLQRSNEQQSQPYDSSKNLENQYLTYWWYASYWFVFFLTWAIYPIINDFAGAGDFTFKQRMKTSFINNLIFYGICLVLILVLVFILFLINGLKDVNLAGFFVALGNAWGLFLIIFFIGYGLVAIPKLMLKLWKIEGRYKHAIVLLASLDVELMDAKFNLEHVMNTVYTLENEMPLSHPLRYEIQIIVALASKYAHLGYQQRRIIDLDHSDREVTHKRLVKLHKKVKEAIQHFCKLSCQWQLELEEAFLLQDVLGAIEHHQLTITSRLRRPRLGKCGYCCDRSQKFFHAYIIRILAVLGFFFSVLLTIMIICGEMTILVSSWTFSFLGVFVAQNNSYLPFHIICWIPLIYLCLSTFYGLFSLKASSFFSLQRYKHSDAQSLVMSATIISRLAAPLCYNFLAMTRVDNASFLAIMGTMQPVPIFGKTFATFFPLILIFLVIINAFNVYRKQTTSKIERILRWLGLSQYGFIEEKDEMMSSGQKLVETKRVERERDFERQSPRKRVYSARPYINALDALQDRDQGSSERLRPYSEGNNGEPQILDDKRGSYDFNFK